MRLIVSMQLLLAVPVALLAQDTTGTPPRDLASLAPGTEVRLTYAVPGTGPRVQAFVGLRSDTLLVRPIERPGEAPTTVPRPIPLRWLVQVDRCAGPRSCRSRARKGAVIGGLVGALGIGLVLATTGDVVGGDVVVDRSAGQDAAIIAFSGAAGMTLGGIIGRAWPHGRWDLAWTGSRALDLSQRPDRPHREEDR